ncbi:hypothetical protein DPMN_105292 [Dreissena polymorpha]|uniref:Uncharacterized protein n=1 Tax=Dreissena polymorpha TaxID=45954 RepID=A0A9D4HDJ7_DREPO|nr:hypothetical protein DPMN_105292 [Dreissena polymorpha]
MQELVSLREASANWHMASEITGRIGTKRQKAGTEHQDSNRASGSLAGRRLTVRAARQQDIGIRAAR